MVSCGRELHEEVSGTPGISYFLIWTMVRKVFSVSKNYFGFYTYYFIIFYTSDFQQEFLKHAIPDYLVRGTNLFSLRLSNNKMTTANTTIAVWCEWIKSIPIFLSDWQKYNIFTCATRWKRLHTAILYACYNSIKNFLEVFFGRYIEWWLQLNS